MAAQRLKYVTIVTEDREFLVRANDYETTDPGSDGLFQVDLIVRGRIVGTFTRVLAVYISQSADIMIENTRKTRESVWVPEEWEK